MKVAVVPALLLALMTAGGGGSNISGNGSVRRAVAGERVAPAPASAAAAADAPRIKVAVVDLDGIKQSMRKSRGRTLLVHFWATWCVPCLQELPVLNQFARDMKPRGVDVLSVSLDDPATATARVARQLSQSAPELTATIAKVDDADRFIANFDGAWEGTIPALFVYDVQGTLRARQVGETTRVKLDRMVSDANRDVVVPAAKK